MQLKKLDGQYLYVAENDTDEVSLKIGNVVEQLSINNKSVVEWQGEAEIPDGARMTYLGSFNKFDVRPLVYP